LQAPGGLLARLVPRLPEESPAQAWRRIFFFLAHFFGSASRDC